MARERPPFRTHLLPTRRGKAGERTLQDLMRIQDGDHWTDPEFLEHIATQADEIVAWTLVQQEKEVFQERSRSWGESDKLSWVKEASKLLTKRAVSEMNNEDTHWTPLADALLLHDGWDADASERGLYELRNTIRSWVRSTKRPSQLEGLLVFRSSLPITAVAECAPKLRWDQLDRLTNMRSGLSGLRYNPEALLPHARKLIQKGERVWAQPITQAYSREATLRRKWLVILRVLVEHGISLPTDLRAAIIAEAELPVSTHWDAIHPPDTRTDAIAAVIADPALTREELVRLIALKPGRAAYKPIMLAKHATLDMHAELLVQADTCVDEEVWIAFLQRHRNLDDIWFDRILREHDYPSSSLLRAIVEHPSATSHTWTAILDTLNTTSGVRILFEVPAALACRDVRSKLLGVIKDGYTAAKLLPYTEGGDEWRQTFVRLIALDPIGAGQLLSSGKIPDDVQFERTDLLPLLASESSEVRLAAMCALSRVDPDLAAPKKESHRSKISATQPKDHTEVQGRLL